jgi:hypothetical protein
MHFTTLSNHMGWFDDKEVDIYIWGLMIKPYKWHNYGQQWCFDPMYPT